MNLLFLTLVRINSLNDRGLYQDLLRKFNDEGHNVFIVTPIERRAKKQTYLFEEDSVKILNVKTLNIKKTNVIEKGLGTLAIESQYLKAINKNFADISFDLILYSTPPITFSKVIDKFKKRDNAYSYLLLKDIFPQNAVDMNLIKESGLLHKYFRKKEEKLYNLSDTIGCMSQANVDYVKKHNTYITRNKIEENPNTISPLFIDYSLKEKNNIRKKYAIPLDKKILVYGGNLGKPQGLKFLLELLDNNDFSNFHFLIVGDGTMYNAIEKWFLGNRPNYVTLLKRLPKDDYDKLLAACDIGLIFLHPSFTIPNFPSRLLSYLEMKKPVITITDTATDIGDVVEKAGCGFKVISGDKESFIKAVATFDDLDVYNDMSDKAWNLLNSKYTVESSYKLIMEKYQNR